MAKSMISARPSVVACNIADWQKSRQRRVEIKIRHQPLNNGLALGLNKVAYLLPRSR